MTFDSSAINWQKIDKIFFDMDGTLLDLHFDNYFWLEHVPVVYAQKHQRSEELDSVKEELYQRIMQKRGSIEWYCLDFWSAELELDIVDLKQQIKQKIKPLPFALEFLELLYNNKQQTQIELWLTTNAHRKGLDLKFQNTHIEKYFDKIISSHDYNAAKEDQRFWHSLQQQYPFDPSRVLFIDDTSSVLSAAQDYGISQLLHILKPDSYSASHAAGDFNAIENFEVLMDSYKNFERHQA